MQSLLNVRSIAMDAGDYGAAYETETPGSAGDRSAWISLKESEGATEYSHTILSLMQLSDDRLQVSYSFESRQEPGPENDFSGCTIWTVHRYVTIWNDKWRLDGEPAGLGPSKAPC